MRPAAMDTDASLLESGAWHTPLTDIEFTLCHGQDTARFLQGQLSCNVLKLTPANSLCGALCSLKGRVITDLQLVADEKGILLLTRHAMRDKLISTLDKYRVFFKTSLEPVNNTLSAIGLGGPDCALAASSIGIVLPDSVHQVTHQTGLKILQLPQSPLNKYPRFMCIFDSSCAEAVSLKQLIVKQFEVRPESLWHLADIRDNIVHVTPAQSEIFTPQLLNYDINGVIDFKKGCYTGQEIVARMYYRSEAKRRLHHLKATSAAIHLCCVETNAVEIVDAIELLDGSVESLGIINEKSLQAVANQVTLTSFSKTHSH